MMLSWTVWRSLSAGSRSWNGASPTGTGHPDPAALRTALIAEARARHTAFLDGVARYRDHPRPAPAPEAPVAWSRGTTRILDRGGRGAPVLLIPSLINRARILDLRPDHSLCGFLVARGYRVLLVDWGAPGPEERRFGLGDYVEHRLEPALAALWPGEAVRVVGYCLGGVLALGLAARVPERLLRLALLATPWDFHADPGFPPDWVGALAAGLGRRRDPDAPMPIDLIQTLFVALDPFGGVEKFTRLGQERPDPRSLDRFVAVEDWVADGVPLAAPAAQDLLAGCYHQNRTARGRWRVGGRAVDPGGMTMPSLHVVPGADRIVPPASAQALAAAMPGARVERPELGHVGMIAGSSAAARVFAPLAAFLAG